MGGRDNAQWLGEVKYPGKTLAKYKMFCRVNSLWSFHSYWQSSTFVQTKDVSQFRTRLMSPILYWPPLVLSTWAQNFISCVTITRAVKTVTIFSRDNPVCYTWRPTSMGFRLCCKVKVVHQMEVVRWNSTKSLCFVLFLSRGSICCQDPGLLVETKRQSRTSVSSAADRSSRVSPKLLLTN